MFLDCKLSLTTTHTRGIILDRGSPIRAAVLKVAHVVTSAVSYLKAMSE